MPARPSVPSMVRTPLRRLVVVVLALVCSVAVLAPPATADPRPYRLTSEQARVVLRLIDDACGDTWCEGDHAFRFRRFTCHTKRQSCALVVQVASWAQEPLLWQWRSQPISGFPRFVDMVSTGPGGWQALRPAFYEAVGEAVRAMEATVPVEPAVSPELSQQTTGVAALLRADGLQPQPPGR